MAFEPKELRGASYPPRLRDLEKPPASVYVVGELPRGPAVAIVGTRKPTQDAASFARKLARGLAEHDVSVFSGGAFGIDTAAHLGALEGRGPTVVVSPSSFDRPFPLANEALFVRIVEEGGAFLTPYPPGTVAGLHHFFERNAMLAAMVDVLVVVESKFRGGARNAAKAARALGRRVLAVPGAPWNPKAAGCLLELKAGAGLAASLNDVLAAVGVQSRAQSKDGESRPGVQLSFEIPDFIEDPDARKVLRRLEAGPANADQICKDCGLEPGHLQALLLTLTLALIVVSDPSGRVSLARH